MVTGSRSGDADRTRRTTGDQDAVAASGKLEGDEGRCGKRVISVLSRAGHASNAYARRQLGWDRTGGLRALELLGL